jgi:acylphosphatase
MMKSEHPQRLHVIVKGRVQGVGFRAFVLEQAFHLSLTGWVRNTWDGNVEVLAEGERSRLETLYGLLNPGPLGSFVESLNPEWSIGTGEYTLFRVERTA